MSWVDPESAKIMSDLQEIGFGDVKETRAENATFSGRSYKQAVDGSFDAGQLQQAACMIYFDEALRPHV